MAQLIKEGKFTEWQEEIKCETCEAVFLIKEEDLIEKEEKCMWVGPLRAKTVSFHIVKCPSCHDKIAVPSSTIPRIVIERFQNLGQ